MTQATAAWAEYRGASRRLEARFGSGARSSLLTPPVITYRGNGTTRTISDIRGLPSQHQVRSQTQRRAGRFSGEAVVGQAHTLKTRALVKLGELLKDLPKATGRRLAGRELGSNKGVGGSRSAPPTNATTYADLGVTKKLASVAQQLAALPEATREAIAQREVTLSQAKREVKAADVTRQRMGEAVFGQAHTLKTRALVKLGELLKDLPKATGTRGQLVGRGVIGGANAAPPIQTLAECLHLPTNEAKKFCWCHRFDVPP